METVILHSQHPLVPLRPKDGPARAVSWAGYSFEPDELGINWLPVEAIAEMTESHGMVGVPGAVVRSAQPDPRDLEIARLNARVAELETPQHLYGPGVGAVAQSKDGGLVRPTIFPPGGEHPLGGPQPALEAASASAPSNEAAKSDTGPEGEPAAVDKPKRAAKPGPGPEGV
jgi:hypothetical protein